MRDEGGPACIRHQRTLQNAACLSRSVDGVQTILGEDVLSVILSVDDNFWGHHVQLGECTVGHHSPDMHLLRMLDGGDGLHV